MHQKHHKKSLSDRIGEEFINEIMMAGIAFLIIMMGVNYFNMKWAWFEVISQVGTSAGVTSTLAGQEVTQMLTALTQTFPFKYFFVQYNFWGALALAVCLTVLGVGLKLFTTYTKGKFVIDVGRNIYVPAIVGFVVIIVLQIWTAINVKDYLVTQGIAHPQLARGFFVWNTYGQLFLFAASILVIGSIVKLLGEKNRAPKGILLGETMFKGSVILLAYYFIIRILTLDVVFESGIGRVIELFIISNQYSNFTIAICIFMYAFGKELKKYGVTMLKKEKHVKHVEEMRQRYAQFKQQYQAKVVQQGHAKPHQQHPAQHHTHQRQHPQHPQHQHRYVQPTFNYRTKHDKNMKPGKKL